ncbi:MAG TPA: carboxypeptidase-like regulatory domain-containing protein [Bryobacteraceae bacterium]|nr:carboxypeptidase-like regulatory domain-containing protein [Bryobacteraceae bacterium]
MQRLTMAFLSVLVVGLGPNAWGQVVGAAISGTVHDETGGALAAASVTIRNVETGAERKLSTDDSGRYAAPSIAVGRYEVSATKEGFSSQVKTGIELTVGQNQMIDLTLPVGQVRQVVTVEEKISPVSVSTQQTSGLVNEKQVKELPLNGRSYDELITLNPAIVNYSSERSGGIGTSNSAVGNMFAVSGHRPQENLFLLNGIEYTGASEINNTPGGASGQLLGVDAVREFNVVTDTYGAEYGKRPGAQVSIITASGSNAVHGSVYEFLRNSDLDARNFFDQGTIPQFQRNEFGGALGAPIKKDKLFVFGNYEGFRQHLGLSDVTLVPDDEARLGYVPGASGKLTHVGVAPSVEPLLALWPVQNGPDLGAGIGEAFSHPLQTIREDFGTARFDYNASDKDTLFGVYTVDDSGDNTPSVNPLSGVVETLREQVVSLQEQHVFSPSVLNTARVGFSRAGYFFTGDTPVDVPGWVAGDPVGALVIGGGTASNGASQISLAGTNAGSNLTAVRNLFTYDDHAAILRGIHQFEVGVWFQRVQANDNLAQDQYGQASFGSLTSFLQGTVSTFTVVPSPTPLGWRSLEAAGFAQDAIRVSKRLEVRIGFRFESTDGWNEAHGRGSNYLFSNGVIETNPRIGDSFRGDRNQSAHRRFGIHG